MEGKSEYCKPQLTRMISIKKITATDPVWNCSIGDANSDSERNDS